RFPRRGERGQTYGRWRSFWYTVYQRSLEGKLLRGEPQPPDQRALELEVGGGLRVEIRASEISDGLPGIGARLGHGVVGQSLAAGGLEPGADRGRDALRGIEAVVAGRHVGLDAKLLRGRHVRKRRMPPRGEHQQRPEVRLAADRGDRGGG